MESDNELASKRSGEDMHFLRDLFSSRIFLIAFSIVIGLTLHMLTEDNREFTESQNSNQGADKNAQ